LIEKEDIKKVFEAMGIAEKEMNETGLSYDDISDEDWLETIYEIVNKLGDGWVCPNCGDDEFFPHEEDTDEWSPHIKTTGYVCANCGEWFKEPIHYDEYEGEI
jgi:DNA-directed RNA polymerase subunit RPC12/RpoP